MDEREELIKAKFGGEIINPEQQQQNIVDLTSSESEAVEETVTEAPTQVEGEVLNLTEESSLNTEETNTETPQAEQQVEGEGIKEEDVLSFLSERLGRDINSFDDFGNGQATAEELEFASEQLRVINDYVKNTGRSVQDYLNTQSVDLSNLSDDVIMKEYLRLENPDLTEAELGDYMADTYRQGKDEYSERESNVGKVQLRKDAKAARDYFDKVKSEYASPLESQDSGMSEAEKADWVGNMESEVDSLEGLSFSMNEQGDEFVYNLDDDARQEIKGYNSNLENFFDKYVNDGGDWDFDKLNTDMYILNNIDKIVRGVANQYKSKGTENVINEIKNPSFNQEKREATPKQETTLDMLRRQILG